MTYYYTCPFCGQSHQLKRESDWIQSVKQPYLTCFNCCMDFSKKEGEPTPVVDEDGDLISDKEMEERFNLFKEEMEEMEGYEPKEKQ